MFTPPRVLGLITAAYSVAIGLRPVLLARPCGLAEGPDQRHVSPAVATLIGGIGARDAAIGTAMVLAPTGPALRLAIAARVASDLGDAVFFGSKLPDPGRRVRIGLFAAGWATLCALSARWAG
jgi:hypothetical protein